MTSTLLQPPPLSSCFVSGNTWFKNELLASQGAQFTFDPNFALFRPADGLTPLYPASPPTATKAKPPTRHIVHFRDVLASMLPAWTTRSADTPAGFAGLTASECVGLQGQARMRHLIALQKLWQADTSVSSELRELINGGAWIYAFGSIFWGSKGAKEGPCVPVAFRLTATDPRIVLGFRALGDDLASNDYALGAPLNLKHF
ncbi:MAG: hypothetical protein RJB39_177 [Candidatus Parcubacteria bacterium]|jgi:hypothetical protein